ncbi:MAG: sugar phosphate nucleotidyltransferase [Caldimicrobium sp.]
MDVKAFILSAGFGTRLKPITEKIPKPLIPILGKPLLERIIKNLNKAEIFEIALNVHHLSEKIINFLEEASFKGKIQIFYEKEILGTGGGLKNAEAFLKEAPFLVHNGDIFTDFDLKILIKTHLEKRPLATLIVLDNPEENKLFLDEEGNLIGVEGYFEPKSYFKKAGFAGIALYEPEFLNFLDKGFSSVVSSWIKAIKAGYLIKTLPLSGFWFDCGNPEGYFKAIKTFLKKLGETAYFHPEAKTDDLDFQGFLSIETETSFERGSFLRNVVVIAEKKRIFGSYEGGILFEERFIPVKGALKREKEEVGSGGSDRKFFRLFNGLILMKDLAASDDFERTYKYGLFLKEKGLNVPEIRGADFEKKEILFEDLGDVSLYTWLKARRNPENILQMYKRVLEEMIKLHTLKVDKPESLRIFDFEHFRWETRYFQEKFLEFFCEMKVKKELEAEFDELARICDSFPKNLIHRDFQSQNVMIKGERPYLIDYQGMRIGPPGYDLSSLLWDPYYQLKKPFRENLLKFYIERRKLAEPCFEEKSFIESLSFLRVQRHLQALAAYVNLSFFKGKRYFLKFILPCLSYLEEEVKVLGFPYLRETVFEAKEKLLKKGFYEEIEEFS